MEGILGGVGGSGIRHEKRGSQGPALGAIRRGPYEAVGLSHLTCPASANATYPGNHKSRSSPVSTGRLYHSAIYNPTFSQELRKPNSAHRKPSSTKPTALTNLLICAAQLYIVQYAAIHFKTSPGSRSKVNSMMIPGCLFRPRSVVLILQSLRSGLRFY